MKKLLALALTSPLILPITAFAQSGSGITDVQALPSGRDWDFTRLLNVINTLIDYLFTILLVLAVVFILIAAFRYLTAGGDEEKVAKAHQILIYAVVAIAVALLAQGIVFTVRQLIQ